MSPAERHLGVFAKFWRPGDVKTRLGMEIGNERAAALYRVFVETTLQRFGGLADRCDLCFWPADRERDFRGILPPGWTTSVQPEGDLGERMDAFFRRALAAGSRRVVLVGSDTPNVPLEYVEHAFALLDVVNVVLGPATDGGYYLVGAKITPPPIFRGIDWSTPAVWEQTTAALERSGLRPGSDFALSRPWADVDTLEDLRQLRLELASSGERDTPYSRLAMAVDKALADDRG